jgi:hypothetical protein
MKAFSLVIVAALALRLFLAWNAEVTADVGVYHFVAESLNNGATLYRDTGSLYPYPPTWSYVERAALYLSNTTGLSFAFLVALPTIFCDVGIGILLYVVCRKRGNSSMAAAIIYLFNPISLVISSLHCQFDAIPIFSSLLAAWATISLTGYQQGLISGLALGAAISLKSYPVLLLPVLLFRLSGHINRLIFLVCAVCPTAILLYPHLATVFPDVNDQLFHYRGVFDQGWAAFLRNSPTVRDAILPNVSLDEAAASSRRQYVAIIAVLALWDLILILCRRGADIFSRMATTFMLFYVLVASVSSQYLLWALPFLLITSVPFALIYTVAGSLALLGFYCACWPDVLFSGIFSGLNPQFQNPVDWWRYGTLVWWMVVMAWFVMRFAEAWRRLLTNFKNVRIVDGPAGPE